MRCRLTNVLLLLGIVLLICVIVKPRRYACKDNYLPKEIKLEHLQEVERSVYKPHGFKIDEYLVPFPVLVQLNTLTCETVFNDWLEHSKKAFKFSRPPHEIPDAMWGDFLMNDYALPYRRYVNEKAWKTKKWTKKQIQHLIDSKTVRFAYGAEGMAVHYATVTYPLSGMTGLVVGSQSPWVEAICMRNGARKVYTVDYQDAISYHPKVQFINAFRLAKNWNQFNETFDFVVSFSSIEHSGLGRYGDPLDPIGDIREVQKIKCLLKPRGLLFIGIPVGHDAVVFNAHRVYGRVRIPMLFEGFTILDIFHEKTRKVDWELPLTEDSWLGKPQYMFVLEKDA